MADVLVIQNSSTEGLGVLGDLLTNDGFTIKTVFAKKEKLLDDDYDLLVVLGGPQSANDDFHYLRQEEKLIRDFVSKEKPVIGICLGSQLIAKAFGAKVYRGKTKEIGFYHDLIKNNADSELLSGFDNPFTVFHWHADTFDLPQNAIRLAHSKNYQNQAFQIQSAVGIQFHIEVDEKMVRLWLDNSKDEFENISYLNPQKIRQEIADNMPKVKNNLELFYKNFKSTYKL